MNILLGLIIIIVGFLITWKAEWMYQSWGTIPFFEKYFHSSGGGRFGYRIIGILIIFVGIMTLTGLHRGILEWLAKKLTFTQ